jgi:hypothetical protein
MRRTLLLLAFAAGCLAADDKGPEEELLQDADGKADTQRKPTDHGAIAFDAPQASALTSAERYHAWEFELGSNANVSMTTSYAILGQRKTDTVLYLYKESATGWGAYIARNDDYDGKVYSRLIRDLGAGRYRVLVKGHSATTMGKFKVTVGCSGAGCAPVDTNACLFGDTYHDIPDQSALQTIATTKITPANLDTLGADLQHMLVVAVQQSSHTDVTTPQEALSRVDQQEINLTFLAEPLARRTFVAMEYGAGDNSYGGIFNRSTSELVSKIHDGDLEACTVSAETCLLPEDWSVLRTDPAFTQTASRVVTQASQLDALETQQALEVFRHSYDDVTTVADGLSRVDGGQLDVVAFTHAATGTKLTVFEYGAGDTSVGGVFFAGSLNLAGRINDLAIEACTFFAN